MTDFLLTFSNREIAIAAWLFIGLTACLIRSSGLRSSVSNVFRTLVSPVLICPFLLMAVYAWAVVAMLTKAGIWHPDLAKDTLFWFLGTAAVLYVKVPNAAGDTGFFKKTFLDCLKLSVAVQFLMSTYVFSLPVELVLVPFLFTLGALIAVSQSKPEFSPAAKAFSFLATAAGSVILFLTVRQAWEHSADFAKPATYHQLLLPSLLTIGLIPFIFLLAVLSEYQMQFIRLNAWIGEKPLLARAAKLAVIKKCGLNLGKLRRLKGEFYIELREATTVSQVRRIIARRASSQETPLAA